MARNKRSRRKQRRDPAVQQNGDIDTASSPNVTDSETIEEQPVSMMDSQDVEETPIETFDAKSSDGTIQRHDSVFPTDTTLLPHDGHGLILSAIEDNTRLLEDLIRRLDAAPAASAASAVHSGQPTPSNAELETAESETADRVRGAASKDARESASESSSRSATVDDADPSRSSWEQQKAAMLAAMEADQFDAENFIQRLATTDSDACPFDATTDPIDAVHNMFETMERLHRELSEANEELMQIKRTLSERAVCAVDSETGIATGAAAIASIMGGDELVAEERERLKELQSKWEKKFREIEVETSLERAKLSRERQQLAEKLAAAEQELVQAKREQKTDEDCGHAKRRWLAKLGIE